MHSALHTMLIDYWLTELEASIYLTLLEIGRWTAESINVITSIDLYQINQILDDMYTHGYVYRIAKDWIYNFIASSPSELIINRKEACTKLAWFLKASEWYDFEDDTRQMKEDYQTGCECEIQYYEWVSWLIEYYKQHIATQHPVYAFISPDNIHPILIDYLYKEHVPERVAKQVPVLAITDRISTDQKSRYISLDKESLRETLSIDQPLFHIWAWINIFDSASVWFVMYNQDEMSALTIKSKELFESLHSIFLYIRNTYYTKKWTSLPQ